MQIHRQILLVAILSLLGCSKLNAQDGGANNINFEVKHFAQEGNSLHVDIDFDLQALNMSTREQLILTPVLRNGDQELKLSPLIINGKIRHKVYLRQKEFSTLKDDNKDAIEVVKAGKQKKQVASYSTVVNLEDWMKQSSLYLDESHCPGCGKVASRYERLLAAKPTLEIEEVIVPDKYEPLFSFVTPPADTVKIGNKQGSAYLKFHVGKSEIDPSLANNTIELDKIHTTLDVLLKDENITIKSISITGFASIEGAYAFNKRLSEQRAKSLNNYLQGRYNLPASLFHVDWMGEDWDGLIKLIEDGNMDKKQEVLAIINDTDIFDGREKRLMQLDGGRPYRFMINEYFPLLRKVNYVIEYRIPEYGLDESKKILKERPDQLSRKELFILAESYGKGSAEFCELLIIAHNLYPQDDIAEQNASAAYAMRGNYAQAEQLALQSANNGNALNNLGAIYLLQGKLEDAKKAFSKAKQEGSKEASYNLNELSKIIKN